MSALERQGACQSSAPDIDTELRPRAAVATCRSEAMDSTERLAQSRVASALGTSPVNAKTPSARLGVFVLETLSSSSTCTSDYMS